MFDATMGARDARKDNRGLIGQARDMIERLERHREVCARLERQAVLRAGDPDSRDSDRNGDTAPLATSVRVHNRSDLYDLVRLAIVSVCARNDGAYPDTDYTILVDPDVYLHIDGVPLLRVLVNLIDTASAKGASQRIHAVSVHVRQDDGRMIFRVSDDGPGLSYWEQAALQMGAKAHTRPTQLGGIGLLTASHVARELGGRIELRQTGPSGTVVQLVVPDALPNPALREFDHEDCVPCPSA